MRRLTPFLLLAILLLGTGLGIGLGLSEAPVLVQGAAPYPTGPKAFPEEVAGPLTNVRCVETSSRSVTVSGVIHDGVFGTGWTAAHATVLALSDVTRSLASPRFQSVGSGTSLSFYLSPSQSRSFRFTIVTSGPPAGCSVFWVRSVDDLND